VKSSNLVDVVGVPMRIRVPRLWFIAASCFAGGLVGRLCVESTGDTANAYGVAVHWQWYFFGAGLAFLLAWIVLQAKGNQQAIGWAIWAALLVASGFAIITSIPK
jgi:hypothetical protein